MVHHAHTGAARVRLREFESSWYQASVSLLEMARATLRFGARSIFEATDLRIESDDRIGLVGPNGSGKTSLLRVIAGEQELDGGALHMTRGIRIGYLPQDIAVEGGAKLLDFVLGSVPGRTALAEEIEGAEAAMNAAMQAYEETGGGDEEEITAIGLQLAALHERQGHFDTFYTKHEAAKILHGLGFAATDHERDLGEFSGGWKMRAVLAALLFQRPELLLLDEPTNHLDVPSVAWLSEFLRRSDRAFILISHDREFLDGQIDRIVSFEPEGVRHYKGNYSKYVAQREEEAIILENRAKNLERERAKAEAFITRFRAQANKAKAVQSRVKALERMEAPETYVQRRTMTFSFAPTKRTSATVLKVDALGKSYGTHPVFSGVDLTVNRGDRIGIIGVNGAGKTTLLRIIGGELAATNGTVQFGSHVESAYYAQHHCDVLEKTDTLFESVARVDPSAGQTRVRTLLGAFLFSGDDVDKQVGVLSGGERARVALARLLSKPGNMLLMDEPTNHLDLASSDSLAESLTSFDGTTLFVSHNLAFVRRLATRIWNVEDGRVEDYPGTLDEYLERARRMRAADEAASGASKAGNTGRKRPPEGTGAVANKSGGRGGPKAEPPSVAGPAQGREHGRAKRKLEAARRRELRERLGPLEKEVKSLEARIESLEEAQRERSVELSDPATYDDAKRRRVLLDEYQRDADELERLTSRWEMKSAQLEAMTEA